MGRGRGSGGRDKKKTGRTGRFGVKGEFTTDGGAGGILLARDRGGVSYQINYSSQKNKIRSEGRTAGGGGGA